MIRSFRMFASSSVRRIGVRWYSARSRPRTEVVLRSDVAGLGFAGETAKVKAGYARNDLIPKRLAAYATKDNVDKFGLAPNDPAMELIRHKREIEYAKRKIGKIHMKFRRQPFDNGKDDSYKRVISSSFLADELFRLYKIDMSEDQFELENGPLSRYGSFEVGVRVDENTVAPLKILVERG